MLQSISSTRGLAQQMANTYWPLICSKLYPVCVELDADYATGEILMGEHKFDNGAQLFWTTHSDATDRLTIMLELSINGAGICSVAEVVLSQGTIDSKRSDAFGTTMQHAGMLTMNDNMVMLDTIKQIIDGAANAYLTKAATYTLKADTVTKGQP